ncbi:MAG: tetratricopeptide repeat protein [Elusimicrobiales bacterium]|nr:tetratricopeptide repeat protein [Elusimicrobiales bacterium]
MILPRLRLAIEAAGPWAPAFFLVLAVAAGGLRSPETWLLFGAVFLPWAALSIRGLAGAGLTAPLLFFFWVAVAALFSPGPLVSLGASSRYAVFGLLFFYAASSEEGDKRWLAAVYGLGLAAAAVFILQRIMGQYLTGLIGANPNYSTVFCAAGFPAAVLALSGTEEKKEKFLYSALALLLAAGIAAAASRGAALAAFLSAAAGLGFARRWKWLAGLFAAGLAAAAFLPASGLEILFKFHDPRAFARPRLWGAALDAAAASPLLGWGPGRFGEIFEAFKFPYFDGLSFYGHSTLHAHSEILNLAAEAGFPAAALFLLTAGAALYRGGREKFPLKLCALAAFIQGGADMIFYSGAAALLFWGSLGFSAGGAPAVGAAAPRGGAAVPVGGKLIAALCALCFFGLALGPVAGLFSARQEFISSAYREASLARNPALDLALARSAALESPKDVFAAAVEGGAFAAVGDAAGAEAAFGRALSLEPGFAGARLGLAVVYAASGRGGEACAELAILGRAPAAVPADPYGRGLVRFDRRAAEKLEKELCRKKKNGAATASRRMTR